MKKHKSSKLTPTRVIISLLFLLAFYYKLTLTAFAQGPVAPPTPIIQTPPPAVFVPAPPEVPIPEFKPLEGVDNETFDNLNPLKLEGDPSINSQLSTPGGIVSRILLFAFPTAGLILFVMLVWGGFEILATAATAKSVEAGKQRITAAFVGFILLFCSYWIMQIIEEIFGLVIL